MGSTRNFARRLEFDPRKFADWQSSTRAARGWSTRDLAERAGISQPYVVALERARLSQDGRTPVPTVNVVAAIASALGVDPISLMGKVMRLAPRHVLLILDGSVLPPIDVIREESGDTADAWICGRPANAKIQVRPFVHDIRLHRESMKDYDQDKISALLDRELGRIVAEIEGKDLGFIFGESTGVMETVTNPDELIELETRWKDIVAESAARVGAHAAWNVCVYQAHILRDRNDIDSTMDFLFAQHDEHWFAKGSKVHTGESAKEKMLRAVT
ncbi:MAG: helix-turn-helix domain-containing protein [Actinomycetota bacterium]